MFLSSDKPNEILAALRPEWNGNVGAPLSKKLLIINYSLLIQEVFPWKDEVSEGLDHEKFCESFFVQPDLFLRLRPGKGKLVTEKLQWAKIDFTTIF